MICWAQYCSSRKKISHGARSRAQQSDKLDSHNTDALIKLGEVQRADGQVDKAIATYQQALTDNPQEATFYVLLGQIFQSRKNWDKAEDSYQKALGISRDDPVAACNLAYVLNLVAKPRRCACRWRKPPDAAFPSRRTSADTFGLDLLSERCLSLRGRLAPGSAEARSDK